MEKGVSKFQGSTKIYQGKRVNPGKGIQKDVLECVGYIWMDIWIYVGVCCSMAATCCNKLQHTDTY